MIPTHASFIEAIGATKKVSVRFFSKADRRIFHRVCAPMDYGPGDEADKLNRYWLWDYRSNTDSHTLGLLPQQIMELEVLSELFDPTQFIVTPPRWSIPRDWNPQTASVET